MQLRDYQKGVLSSLYSHLGKGKRSGYIFAPTGAGKTVIASQMVADAIARNRRVLFCVHRTKLVEQTANTMQIVTGIKPGIIAPGYPEDFDSPIQIGMLQTLASRYKRKGANGIPHDIGLVVFDECHISISFDIAYQLMLHYSGGIVALGKCFFVGLTATPWRTNPKEGLCQYFQFSVKAPSPRELINQGHLTRERILVAQAKFSAKLETDNSGDYTSSSLIKACGNEFNSDIVEKFQQICPDKKTIAFCVGVKAAEDLTKQFNEAGIPAEVLVGGNSESERQAIFGRFKYGITRVLVSVGTLTEGFDESSIECVLIARPTRSMALLIQMVGRGLRLHEGKDECLIVDFGECFDWISGKKMGGYEIKDPINLSYAPLCPQRRRKVDIMTKECHECAEEIPIFAAICPHCGYEFPSGKIESEKRDKTISFFLCEFQTKDQRKAWQWLRKDLVKRFENNKETISIFERFKVKYGYLPPHDWFIGAIFNFQESDINAEIYTDKLRRANLGIKDSMIAFFLKLEFGEPGRVYILPDGEYTPKEHSVKAFDWWEYLEIGRFAKEQEIKESYAKKVLTESCPTALNYALKTGLQVRAGKK